jgi:DHA1 family bicyclomycin/chloramphenicol resistance-like MFS transporter
VREGVSHQSTAQLTLILGAVMALGPLAIDMYLPALPTLQSEFAASAARAQHTLSAYLFGMAAGQLAFGPLADRFGRKRPLLGGLAFFALASAGCALSQSIGSLVALRFAQAHGGSAGVVVVRSVIRDRFDVIQSARVLSTMLLVMGVAPILAPLAGGWILVASSWRWIFWFLLAYALFGMAVGHFFLRESHPAENRSPSLLKAIGGFGPLARDPAFLGPLLVFVASFGAFFAYLAAAPFVYIQHFGVPAERFGLLFGAGALGFVTVSQVNRRLVTGRGPRRVLGWGVAMLAFAAASLLFFALTALGGLMPVFLSLCVAIGSLGLISSNASVIAMAPHGQRAGGASSLLGAGQSLTGVLTSAAVGWAPGSGPVPMAVIVALCAAIALAAYVTLVKDERPGP